MLYFVQLRIAKVNTKTPTTFFSTLNDVCECVQIRVGVFLGDGFGSRLLNMTIFPNQLKGAMDWEITTRESPSLSGIFPRSESVAEVL